MEKHKSVAEKRLWGTVLLLAINDSTYQGNDPSLRREKEYANRWFRAGGRDFNEVCSNAGLDPVATREAYIAGRIDKSMLNTGRQGRPRAGMSIP